MFFNMIIGLLLENKGFSIWDPFVTYLFSSIGASFKIALISIIGGFFKVGESIYSVFRSLALATDIFDRGKFNNIANNVYGLFGVIILFIAAYNFLMYVIDPDKNSGEMSIGKMLTNTLKVFIIIVLLPTIFSLANGLIGSIVEGNIIETIIFGDVNSTDCDKIIDKYYEKSDPKNASFKERAKDNRMSYAMVNIFTAFFTSNDGKKLEDIKLIGEDEFYFPHFSCPGNDSEWGCSLKSVADKAQCTGTYSDLFAFGANWQHDSDEVKFEFFLALLSVCYMIYVLVSFCFDLGVRAVKLAFYQVVAPLCVGCSILPGPKKEIFTKWRSVTIKTYTEVLVRVFAMTLGVFFISMIDKLMANVTLSYSCNGFCEMLVKLFLILGILTFIKQMPKLIDDLLGEDSGLGKTVRDKFKESGVGDLARNAGKIGAVGAAGIVGAGRGIKNAWNKGKELKQKRATMKEQKDAIAAQKAKMEAHASSYHSRNGDKYKQMEKELANMEKGLKTAKIEKRRAARGMLGGLAGIGTGALSSAFRSVGAFTNGFGLNEWKKEFSALGGNVMSAAEGADAARKRRADRITHRQENRDANGILKGYGYDDVESAKAGLEARKKALEPKKAQLDAKNAEIDGIRANVEGLQAQKGSIEAKINEGSKTINAAKAEASKLQAEYDKAMDLAQNGDMYQRSYNKSFAASIKGKLDAANAQVVSLEAEQTALQTNLSGINSQLNAANSELTVKDKAKVKLEASVQAESVEIKGLEDAITDAVTAKNALFKTQKIQEIKANFVTIFSPDQSDQLKALQGIQDVLESSMKAAESNAQSLIDKFGDKIKVSINDSLSKSTILCSGKDAQGNIILTDSGKALDAAFSGKSVTQIKKLSDEIKECTNPAVLKDILIAAGVDKDTLTGDMQGLLSDLKAGLVSFDGAYGKEVKKQVVDNCSGADGAKNIFVGYESVIQGDPLYNQIKSDARVAEQSFQQANLGSIFGTTSFSDAKHRKDAMDKLTEAITALSEENAIRQARDRISNIRNPKDKK